MDEIVYEEDDEESKQEEPNAKVNGTAKVDADLFQQEAVDGDEEEPDFD